MVQHKFFEQSQMDEEKLNAFFKSIITLDNTHTLNSIIFIYLFFASIIRTLVKSKTSINRMVPLDSINFELSRVHLSINYSISLISAYKCIYYCFVLFIKQLLLLII